MALRRKLRVRMKGRWNVFQLETEVGAKKSQHLDPKRPLEVAERRKMTMLQQQLKYRTARKCHLRRRLRHRLKNSVGEASSCEPMQV